ncbi:hypothetical protein AEA42_18650, partial [Shewanella sp. Sh95]
ELYFGVSNSVMPGFCGSEGVPPLACVWRTGLPDALASEILVVNCWLRPKALSPMLSTFLPIDGGN